MKNRHTLILFALIVVVILAAACKKSSESTQVDNIPDRSITTTPAAAAPQDRDVNMQTPEPSPTPSYQIINDGDYLFNKYYELVEHTDMNDDYFNAYVFYGAGESIRSAHIDLFDEYLDATKDHYLALSWLERMLMVETYLSALRALSYNDHERYFSTAENFFSRAVGSVPRDSLSFGEEAADAFNELMLWQYQYILDNGEPFFFMFLRKLI